MSRILKNVCASMKRLHDAGYLDTIVMQEFDDIRRGPTMPVPLSDMKNTLSQEERKEADRISVEVTQAVRQGYDGPNWRDDPLENTSPSRGCDGCTKVKISLTPGMLERFRKSMEPGANLDECLRDFAWIGLLTYERKFGLSDDSDGDDRLIEVAVRLPQRKIDLLREALDSVVQIARDCGLYE